MNYFRFMGLIGLAALLAACESTSTAGRGNQEQKRLAAIQQEQHEDADVDEAKRNLWNSQHDVLTRDGNAALRYY